MCDLFLGVRKRDFVLYIMVLPGILYWNLQTSLLGMCIWRGRFQYVYYFLFLKGKDIAKYFISASVCVFYCMYLEHFDISGYFALF